MKIDVDNFIQQLKNKNSKALEYTVDNYGDFIYKIVSSVLSNSSYSECIDECVNDIFMLMLNNLSKRY